MKAAQVEVFVVTFLRPDRPMSENEARGANHWEISRRLDPWKAAVRVAWDQARKRREPIIGQPCFVEMELPFARRGKRDPSNYIGTVVKASVDMLVHVGVWPDDTPDWVTILEPKIIIGEVATLRLIPRVLRESRAVRRRIEPGNTGVCARCAAMRLPTADSRLKFAARHRGWQIITNVYEGGQWVRVDHFHPECYEAMGEPYGPPLEALHG